MAKPDILSHVTILFNKFKDIKKVVGK